MFYIATFKANKGFTIVEMLVVVVVIAILAAISIVSYNGITGRARDVAEASALSQWQTKAALYRTDNNISECPPNYAFVYGNSLLGTSPFCVMKYEAKNVGGVATSQASDLPWVFITQTDAVAESIEAGGHLLTEAEWMTIAADVLSVKYNWSGGEVGSGIIWQGHVNSNPASALAASTDDANNLNGITAGTGTTSGNNSSRVLYLSSGDAIWDFSGNVWEWTQQAVGTPTLTMSNVGVTGDAAYNWRDYNLGSLSLGNFSNASKPATLSSWVNPVNNVSLAGILWEPGKGVGRIFANYADTGARAFIRGGSWSGTSYAGVFALNLSNGPTAPITSVGFRVAR